MMQLSFATSEKELADSLGREILPFYYSQVAAGSMQTADGLTLQYGSLKVPADKGALLILPGRTEAMIKYAELVYNLRTAGFSIYLLDHRGQGFSERMLPDPRRGHVENFADYVSDLKLFVDTVVKKGKHNRLFILSHSMGGTISVLYAAMNPGDVDGLVLCAPMLGIRTLPLSKPFTEFLVRGMAIGLGDSLVIGGNHFDSTRKFAGNRVTGSRERFMMNRALIAANPEIKLGAPTYRWLWEAMKAGRQAVQQADRIKSPVLLLQAGRDGYVCPAAQADFCQNTPDCRLHVVEGARHEILMETDSIRDWALAMILDFLQKKTGNPRPVGAGPPIISL